MQKSQPLKDLKAELECKWSGSSLSRILQSVRFIFKASTNGRHFLLKHTNVATARVTSVKEMHNIRCQQGRPTKPWIYICYVEGRRPPLWSSRQSSWLQIQRSGFDSQRYQIFWEVVSLERGPLSLKSTTEELLGKKISGSGLGNREYGRRESAALTTRHSSLRKNVGTNFSEKLICLLLFYQNEEISLAIKPSELITSKPLLFIHFTWKYWKKNWSRIPDGRLAPRRTGRLIVGRNVTLTLTLTLNGIHRPSADKWEVKCSVV
jgi:hypothetical protein